MAANYVLLEKITVGAAKAASVTFSGIPQTGYTDLVLKVSSRFDAATSPDIYLQFNGDTGNNYRWVKLLGNGTSVSSTNANTVSQIDGG